MAVCSHGACSCSCPSQKTYASSAIASKTAPTIAGAKKRVALLVGARVGLRVGAAVGEVGAVGVAVGDTVGAVGCGVGPAVGDAVGAVGGGVGPAVRAFWQIDRALLPPVLVPLPTEPEPEPGPEPEPVAEGAGVGRDVGVAVVALGTVAMVVWVAPSCPQAYLPDAVHSKVSGQLGQSVIAGQTLLIRSYSACV